MISANSRSLGDGECDVACNTETRRINHDISANSPYDLGEFFMISRRILAASATASATWRATLRAAVSTTAIASVAMMSVITARTVLTTAARYEFNLRDYHDLIMK